jgi:hypothetical protein
MAKKFSELREKMSPEARTESNRLFEEALKEYPLAELRNARGLSQEYEDASGNYSDRLLKSKGL